MWIPWCGYRHATTDSEAHRRASALQIGARRAAAVATRRGAPVRKRATTRASTCLRPERCRRAKTTASAARHATTVVLTIAVNVFAGLFLFLDFSSTPAAPCPPSAGLCGPLLFLDFSSSRSLSSHTIFWSSDSFWSTGITSGILLISSFLCICELLMQFFL